jgi:hypothetical protein
MVGCITSYDSQLNEIGHNNEIATFSCIQSCDNECRYAEVDAESC